jgi:hypothetical protein
MTALPQVSNIEAQAVALAKQRLSELSDGFSSEAGQAFARNMLKAHALLTPFGMSNIMHDARCGSELDHRVLVELIADYNRRGEKLPPQLATYDIDAHNPYLPPRIPGRKKANHVVRNMMIVLIIDELTQKFGLRAVRNRASKAPARRPSACSVLAIALADVQPAGQALGERAIELIWEKFRHFAFARRDDFKRFMASIPAASIPAEFAVPKFTDWMLSESRE